jgi:hypothetical protein
MINKEPIELEIKCYTPEEFERIKEFEKLGLDIGDDFDDDNEESGMWKNGMFSLDCFYPSMNDKRTIIYSGGTSFTCKLTYNELKEKLNLK